MPQQSVFYYPYASFVEKQSLLLKAAALHFDKVYILDPEKANFGQIGIGALEQDVCLLEQEKILERVASEKSCTYLSAIALPKSLTFRSERNSHALQHHALQ